MRITCQLVETIGTPARIDFFRLFILKVRLKLPKQVAFICDLSLFLPFLFLQFVIMSFINSLFFCKRETKLRINKRKTKFPSQVTQQNLFGHQRLKCSASALSGLKIIYHLECQKCPKSTGQDADGKTSTLSTEVLSRQRSFLQANIEV
jgi:hypothetical protein